MSLPLFIDIDGTLTDDGENFCGKPNEDRIERVRELIAAKIPIVIWSGSGTEYAQNFCIEHGLLDGLVAAIGKPRKVVDDYDTVLENIPVMNPRWLDYKTDE